MLATSPWAGPAVKVIGASSVKPNRGKRIGEIDRPFEMELITDERAADKDELLPRDIHESGALKLF